VKRIIATLDEQHSQTIYLPFYVNFTPFLRLLPSFLRDFAQWVSPFLSTLDLSLTACSLLMQIMLWMVSSKFLAAGKMKAPPLIYLIVPRAIRTQNPLWDVILYRYYFSLTCLCERIMLSLAVPHGTNPECRCMPFCDWKNHTRYIRRVMSVR
jgi:hypothetical protein